MNLNPNIMVVDDDRMSLLMIQHNLLDLGYATEGFSSAIKAIETLERNPKQFDVVILDRLMPDVDGLALTAKILGNETLKHLPVIMITGADASHEIKEGIDAGVFYYLTKPVKRDIIQSVVGAALRHASQQATLSNGNDGFDAFPLMNGAKFTFQTLFEAEAIAGFVANAFPDPERAVGGVAALLFNAVEHGICQIGFDAKGRFLREGTLNDEIDNRLKTHSEKTAEAVVTRANKGTFLSVKDPGPGFNWRTYISLDMSRTTSGHGRGIVRARSESFDRLLYRGCGNSVLAFTSQESNLEW